ncbi:hypothetical protein ZTR_06134 [Talaromyces verruculosus]|nr:hypothetical protein ZTR_06134 [Talaromyces verruculosus]
MSSIRSKEDFLKYISAFNLSDHDTYSEYYAPNAVMALGAFVLNGKDAIMDFFHNARQTVLENVDATNIIITEKALVITANITFTAIVDLKEPLHDIGPAIGKGGKFKAPFVVYYELDEHGQMLNISAGRTAPAEVIPPPS